MQMSITYTKGHETKKANCAKTNTIHETKEKLTNYAKTNTMHEQIQILAPTDNVTFVWSIELRPYLYFFCVLL